MAQTLQQQTKDRIASELAREMLQAEERGHFFGEVNVTVRYQDSRIYLYTVKTEQQHKP